MSSTRWRVWRGTMEVRGIENRLLSEVLRRLAGIAANPRRSSLIERSASEEVRTAQVQPVRRNPRHSGRSLIRPRIEARPGGHGGTTLGFF